MVKKTILSIMALVFLFILPLKTNAIANNSVAAYPANPDPANYLTKSWFIYKIDLGESKEDTLILRNDSEEIRRYKLYPVDATTNNVGGFALEKEADTREGIGAWVELATSSVTLEPGEIKKIDFTITIPEDASAGEHSGGIIVEKELTDSQKNVQGGFVITTRLGVRIYQTVPGKIIRELDFSSAILNFEKLSETYVLSYSIKNWGNITMEPEVKIGVEDMFFGKQDSVTTNKLLIPRESNASSRFEFEKPRMGKFKVTLSMAYPDDNGKFKIVEYPEKFVFWIIPWTEIIVIAVIILANLMFLLISWHLKKKEEKAYIHYKVKTGDDLEKIAKKFGIKWKKLAKINNLKAPFKIEVNKDILVLNKNKVIEKGEEIKEKAVKEIKEAAEEVKSKIKELKPIKRERRKMFELYIIVLILIIAVVVVSAFFIMSNNKNEASRQVESGHIDKTLETLEVVATTTNEVIEEESENEEVAEEPTVDAPATEPRYDIGLKILNGNGVSGAAGEASKIFEEAGFLNIDTGNADHYGYEGATVLCGAKVDTDTCQALRKILLSSYKEVEIEKMPSLDYEVEIIIGAKK